MPATDHILVSQRVITPSGMKEAAVWIKDGKVLDVTDQMPGTDLPVTDLGDRILMPGIVDPHVHINEPGRTEWEGFDSATRAALAGGITSLVEMPLNASPVTTTVQAYEEKLRSAGETGQTGTIRPAGSNLHCHCGFWGGVIPGNEKEIEPLIRTGVLGFKAFLTHSGIDEFPNVSEEDLRKVMPIIAKHGLPILVHCELSDTTGHLPLPTYHYSTYLHSRPKSWEDRAIALMIRLCEEYECRTHIVHLSSADSLEQIRAARQKGLPLTVETCPHYLYFCAEEIKDGHTEFKCAPPIREKANNEKLWQGLKEGVLDFVATDHSPAPPEMKETVSGDFMKAWGGISSIQFPLPVMWTAARKRGFGPEDLARWLCENSARLPGLQKKGRIETGGDADFTVWDPEESFTLTEKMILHRHKLTPYLEEQLYGVVKQTWLAGEKVYDEGKFLHLNRGKILRGKEGLGHE